MTNNIQNENLEWLEVNHLGGFASSKINGVHSRKYHSLLTTKLEGYDDKYNFLHSLDEFIVTPDVTYNLNISQYGENNFFPKSESRLNYDFSNINNPKWTYTISPDIKLEKQLLMLKEENIVLIRYFFKTDKSIFSDNQYKLILKPRLGFRSFHHTQMEKLKYTSYHQSRNNILAVSIKTNEFQDPYRNFKVTLPALNLYIESDFTKQYVEDKITYNNLFYSEELQRGYPASENLDSIGYFELSLIPNQSLFFAASVEPIDSRPLIQYFNEETFRREKKREQDNKFISLLFDKTNTSKKIKNQQKEITNFYEDLSKAARQFVIKTYDNHYSIVAGYHWFGEWGRDTMIALPGCLLYSDMNGVYKKILRNFINYEKQGLIPNIIGKSKETSAYNSVDASLWLFEAFYQLYLSYQEISSQKDLLNEFWHDLKYILLAYKNSQPEFVEYKKNTGLLLTGTDIDSLSWMDACIDGQAVTPRKGYLIEINALWYNAVSIMEKLADSLDDIDLLTEIKPVKERLNQHFVKSFWNEEKQYLNDFIRYDGFIDTRLRANQLIALSLSYSAVSDFKAAEIITNCEDKLFTPYGIRTLAAGEDYYHATYEGDQRSRDNAYHNGTAWQWILGHFYLAKLKFSQNKVKDSEWIFEQVIKIQHHFYSEAGYKSISEIADSENNNQARGCIAQAWSVAEIRRVIIEILKN